MDRKREYICYRNAATGEKLYGANLSTTSGGLRMSKRMLKTATAAKIYRQQVFYRLSALRAAMK